MEGTLPVEKDFTFAPRHLGTLRFNDAEVLTVIEVLEEDGTPKHGVYTLFLDDDITGTHETRTVDFTSGDIDKN